MQVISSVCVAVLHVPRGARSKNAAKKRHSRVAGPINTLGFRPLSHPSATAAVRLQQPAFLPSGTQQMNGIMSDVRGGSLAIISTVSGGRKFSPEGF